MSSALISRFASLRDISKAVGGYSVLCDVLGVLSVFSALVQPNSWVTGTLLLSAALVVLVGPVYEGMKAKRVNLVLRFLIGTGSLARTLVVLAAMVIDLIDGAPWWAVGAALVLCLLLVGEQAMLRAVRSAQPVAANIPGWVIEVPSAAISHALYAVDTAAMVLFAVAAATQLTELPALIATFGGLGLAIVLGVQAARYLYRRNRFEQTLPKLLDELAPVFAFHWQAPVGTAYQASMWLPYLARIGKPYFVLVRTTANFNEVVKLTDAPVILRNSLEDLDPVICSSLKVVFYANTAVRNSHMIRFPHLTHIQLNHGDSDKIASVSPTFRQYDKNFVAGQAAIDRFAKHGVVTRDDSFVIVGRPQLEHVAMAKGPISAVEHPTVLYSPTWSGFYEDSDYSSLRAGKAIVQALVDRGCTVVFRPHPYARKHKANAAACTEIIELLTRDARETGRAHVFGPAAETTMSLVDCFNASDAMVSDVSSVVSDYLISGKPFAMAAVSAHGDRFIDEFPQADAAYVFDVVGRTATGLPEVLDDMLGPDSRAEKRASLRTYYLSDTPPERAADRFLEAARSFLV